MKARQQIVAFTVTVWTVAAIWGAMAPFHFNPPWYVRGTIFLAAATLLGVWAGHLASKTPGTRLVWVAVDVDEANRVMGVFASLATAKAYAQNDLGPDYPPIDWTRARHGRYEATVRYPDGEYLGEYQLRPHLVAP